MQDYTDLTPDTIIDAALAAVLRSTGLVPGYLLDEAVKEGWTLSDAAETCPDLALGVAEWLPNDQLQTLVLAHPEVAEYLGHLLTEDTWRALPEDDVLCALAHGGAKHAPRDVLEWYVKEQWYAAATECPDDLPEDLRAQAVRTALAAVPPGEDPLLDPLR